MSGIRQAYEIIIPQQLEERWNGLSWEDHRRLSKRLKRAARAAFSQPQVVWPEGEPGKHRGRHRAIVDDLWVLYKVNDQAFTLNVEGFGTLD